MRLRLFLSIVVLAFGGLLVAPLAAHSEVFERAPESGQVVGGTVDHVDISFWAPIESGVILLAGPSGEPIAVSDTVLAENRRIISTDFDALDEPGTYVVTHTELADDGDVQTARYNFIYDPTSNERVGSLIERDTGPNWVFLGAGAGVILVLVGFFWPGRKSTTRG